MHMRPYFLAAVTIAVGAQASTTLNPTPVANIVLVHGALVDGSSWRGVYDVLSRDGYRVRIVQTPLTGFDDDIAATRRVINELDSPIILVGNSYGGSVITVAGNDPKVKALVYVAALQPDAGETSAEVAPPDKRAGDGLTVAADGYVSIKPSRFGAELGEDLSPSARDFMANSQAPILGSAFTTKLTAAAWHDKPSYAIIATNDRQLDEAVARRMAKRAGSKVTVLEGGHLVFISHPLEVARVIESAARDIK